MDTRGYEYIVTCEVRIHVIHMHLPGEGDGDTYMYSSLEKVIL
jgi:hypothetical protein